MKYPKVVIRKTDVERWTLTIDGVDVPNVTGVSYQREVGSFPFVTFTLIAELFQEDEPMEPVEDYAPWRDRGGDEEADEAK